MISRALLVLAFLIALYAGISMGWAYHLAGPDYTLCIENYGGGPSVPHSVADLSFSERLDLGLSGSAGGAVFNGLLYTSMFIPWLIGMSLDKRPLPRAYFLLGLSGFAIFALTIFGLDPSSYHDCDRKGLSYGSAVMPLVCLGFAALVYLLQKGLLLFLEELHAKPRSQG